jgi:hypothetical protein
MSEDYVYPGLAPFVEAAADRAGVVDPEPRTRARSGWHADAINTALSQLSSQAKDEASGRAPRGTVDEVLRRIDSIRESLAVQAAAIDAAVKEVKDGLPAAKAEPEPAAAKKKARKAVSKDKSKDEKPAGPGKVERDEEGHPLNPPADIDGDGDEEKIPYPGPHTDPTVPPDAGDDDESE